jgi:hypothetical protein
MSSAESTYSENNVSRPNFGNKSPKGLPLQSGGGGGTFDGMEPRVAVLENNVETIKRDIGELKADMSVIRRDVESLKVSQGILIERVAHLPSKGFIVTSLTVATGLLGGLMTLIGAFIAFQDHIKAFLTH